MILWSVFNILSTDGDLVANIYVEGELVKTVDLSQDTGRTAVTPYIDMYYIVYDNGIEVVSSDCDDEVCVHTGHITKSYQVIACVPNQVVIEIVDPDGESIDEEDDFDLDGVVY